MQIHRALVHRRVRARRLDRPQHLARAGVDQHEAVGRGRAQRDPRRGVVVGAPGHKPGGALAQEASVGELLGVARATAARGSARPRR